MNLRKKALLACSLLLPSTLLFAQWTTSGTNVYLTTTGNNVGVGTTAPAQKLTVAGGLRIDDNNLFTGGLNGTNQNTQPWLHFGNSASGEGIGSNRSGSTNVYGLDFYSGYTPRLTITNQGSVGIGTQNPDMRLTIMGGLRIDAGNSFSGGPTGTNGAAWLSFGTTSGEGVGSNRAGGSNLNGLDFYSSYQVRMSLTNGGNVLIGKTAQTNPNYKLDIAGSARADKLIVNTTGADFVFAPTYQLPSLTTVAAYIKTNHHLPDIAPADEMKKDGLDVGDNQTKLLQKVEELTLYMIEMKKEMDTMKQRLHQLEKKRK